jgi:hypothetical protein
VAKLVKNSSCGCGGKLRADLHGLQIGNMQVIERQKDRKNGHVVWKLLCGCGQQVLKTTIGIKNMSGSASCGCKAEEKSSVVDTKEYSSWEAMKQRCSNPNSKYYEYYGGRGISYDPRWEKFENFYEDMGDRPEGFVLDRIDANAGYSRTNCRWIDKSESSYNTRMQRNNTSGKTGVIWSNKEQRWVARIDFKGKAIRLGAFKDKEQAIAKRKEAEIEYFGYNKD